MRVTFPITIFATALTAAASPLLASRQLLVSTAGKPSLVARDGADPGHTTPKFTNAFWIVLGLCLGLFILLCGLYVWAPLNRFWECRCEEQKLREEQAKAARLKAANTIDWTTGRCPLPPSEMWSDEIRAEDIRLHRESKRLEKERCERENKKKEMEEARVKREEKKKFQEELDAKTVLDDAAIDEICARYPSDSEEDIGLREMEEGRVVYPTRPEQAVLPGRIPTPKTPPTTFFVPQKSEEQTKAEEAAKTPESSSSDTGSNSRDHSPQPPVLPLASPAPQVTGEVASAEEASPPSSQGYPRSAVISETPMGRSPRRNL